MPRNEPWLVLLAINGAVLLVGFVVLHAARRRPRTVGALIGLAVAAGCGALAYAAHGAAEEHALAWCGAGVALVIVGSPAWLLVSAAQELPEIVFSWAGAVEWARLILAFLAEHFRSRHPSERARGVAQLAMVLFAYLVVCWFFAVVAGVFARLTSGESFR